MIVEGLIKVEPYWNVNMDKGENCKERGIN